MKPHWYKLHIKECPICGKDDSWRERVYGEKPDKVEERTTNEAPEACIHHFYE